MSKGVLLMINIHSLYMFIEMDHMKPSFVMISFASGIIPLRKFKEVIPNAQYKKCDNKINKTWYNFMHEAFFEYMYKVNFLNLFSYELHFLE
jgi:hypothetical protein